MGLKDNSELGELRTKSLKQMAIQIVGMLPDDQEDAELVLGYALALVVGFLNQEKPVADLDVEGNILAFKKRSGSSTL